MLPHPTVLTVLDAAYQPCLGFGTVCTKMRWAPGSGHVPRGFAGALGPPDRVRLVLVTAEPGDPYPWETYPTGPTPRDILEAACASVFRALETGTDLYHKNLRYILDGCFPGMPFREQFERIWITDSVLVLHLEKAAMCPPSSDANAERGILKLSFVYFPMRSWWHSEARLCTVFAVGRTLWQRTPWLHLAATESTHVRAGTASSLGSSSGPNKGVETPPPRTERESNEARAVARHTAATPTAERAVLWLRPGGPAPARGTANAAGSGAVEQGWANAAKQSIMGTT